MHCDPVVASLWLQNVGYYRLSGYWYPYRLPSTDGPRAHQFAEGTRFADVVALYEFDRKLRTLIHDGIERVEVGLRAQIANVLGAISPLATRDSHIFRSTFDVDAWNVVAQKRIDRASRHNEAIRHHVEHHSGTVPIWVLTEVLDFSDVSRLYQGLRSADQWTIASSMGIDLDLTALSRNQQKRARGRHPLVAWFEQLTILRNACAHHGRIWNRSLLPAPTGALRTLPALAVLPPGQSERIHGSLAVIAALLHRLAPGSTWSLKVARLVLEEFEHLPLRSSAEMGFPSAWSTSPLWTQPCGGAPI